MGEPYKGFPHIFRHVKIENCTCLPFSSQTGAIHVYYDDFGLFPL